MNALNIGSRRELFVDNYLIDTLDGASLKLHEPIPAGKAIGIDKEWDGGANFGDCIIELDGKYIMYYRSMKCGGGKDPAWNKCIAVSDDGITWTKPVLQPEGTNYIICVGPHPEYPKVEHFNSCFVDTRPGVPKSERVKAYCSVAMSGEKHTPNYAPDGALKLVFYASENGYEFHMMDPQPTFISDLPNSFDGGCSMFWSEAEQQYVFYYRYSVKLRVDREDTPHPWWRNVARATSKDFMTWEKPERMLYSDTQEQFYVNNTAPYFRAPHHFVGAAARFEEFTYPHTLERAKQIPFEGEEIADNTYKLYTMACSDGVLLTTRAGTNVYDRTFMETFVRPGTDFGDWVARANYPLTGIIPYDDKTMFMYVGRRYLQTEWYIERLVLRTDGFASLYAPWKGGVATTKPIVFTGEELEINYRTGAAGYIRVELLDENGNILPGFQANMCERILGNEIKRIVKWRSDVYPDYALKNLAGKPIRLRFYMKDADIFSLKFN